MRSIVYTLTGGPDRELTSVKKRVFSTRPRADSGCGPVGGMMRQTGAGAVGSWCPAEVGA